MSELGEAAVGEAAANASSAEPVVSNNFRVRDEAVAEEGDGDDDFEDELEEEVVDRDALKKQSTTILDKAFRKTRRLKAKAPR